MTRKCSVEGCERKHNAIGLCLMHYKRVRKYGTIELPVKSFFVCSVMGCGRASRSLGYCNMHHLRLRSNGHTDDARLTVEQRFFSKVQQEGNCLRWRGASTKAGYGIFTYEGRPQGAHRVALKLAGVLVPDENDVDHRCHHEWCVRREHLRVVTRKQNREHLKGAARTNRSSGIRGVYAYGDRWRACVCSNGKSYYFGVHETIEEADLAAQAGRAKLFTHDDYSKWLEKN